MITIRPSGDRGITQTGWLHSRHTFSFGSYHDPNNMGFGSLRVINDDIIRAGTGFATHGHSNMEILSYVISGELRHQDTLGNTTLIKSGEIQLMSAGSGIQHSEHNQVDHDTHFLQIWIVPQSRNTAPRYDQKVIPATQNSPLVIASHTGGEHAVSINQDVTVTLIKMDAGQTFPIALKATRQHWLHVIQGRLTINHHSLVAGDGCAITQESDLALATMSDSADILIFDMA